MQIQLLGNMNILSVLLHLKIKYLWVVFYYWKRIKDIGQIKWMIKHSIYINL